MIRATSDAPPVIELISSGARIGLPSKVVLVSISARSSSGTASCGMRYAAKPVYTPFAATSSPATIRTWSSLRLLVPSSSFIICGPCLGATSVARDCRDCDDTELYTACQIRLIFMLDIVAMSGVALPALRPFDAAQWYFPFQLLFVFSLCERKNEQQEEDNVPLCMTTSGHRVSPVI